MNVIKKRIKNGEVSLSVIAKCFSTSYFIEAASVPNFYTMFYLDLS